MDGAAAPRRAVGAASRAVGAVVIGAVRALAPEHAAILDEIAKNFANEFDYSREALASLDCLVWKGPNDALID